MAEDYVPDDLVEQVEAFKEKTGLSDVAIDRILMGGEYGEIAEHQAKGSLDKYADEMKKFDPDAVILDDLDDIEVLARREALNEITNDKSVELIAEVEEQFGFSKKQLVGILTGASEGVQEVMEQLLEALNEARDFDHIEELKSLKQLPDSEDLSNNIAQSLHGIASSGTVYKGDEDGTISEPAHIEIVNALSDKFPLPEGEEEYIPIEASDDKSPKR